MMRSLRIVLFTCGGLLASPVRPLIAQVAVPVGTAIPVITVSEVSSKTAKRGDALPIVVQADILVDGQVVIRKGASVYGRVTESDKAGLFGHAGKLSIAVDSVHTVDGQIVPLVADLRDTTVKARGANGQTLKDEAAAMAVNQVMSMVSGSDLITGAFRHGDDITYKERTLIPVFTVSYVAVTVPPSTSQVQPTPPPPANPPASGDSGATVGVPAASIALFDASHTWDRALGALALHLSTTPQVRDLGKQILREDSMWQSKGQALAAQSHTPIPVLGAADQANMNNALLSLRGMHGKDFDKAVLQQIYDFESGFIGSVDTQDTVTPMGKLLNQVLPVWKGHMTTAAQLIVVINR